MITEISATRKSKSPFLGAWGEETDVKYAIRIDHDKIELINSDAWLHVWESIKRTRLMLILIILGIAGGIIMDNLVIANAAFMGIPFELIITFLLFYNVERKIVFNKKKRKYTLFNLIWFELDMSKISEKISLKVERETERITLVFMKTRKNMIFNDTVVWSETPVFYEPVVADDFEESHAKVLEFATLISESFDLKISDTVQEIYLSYDQESTE